LPFDIELIHNASRGHARAVNTPALNALEISASELYWSRSVQPNDLSAHGSVSTK
jgi:hypothetical protein